MGIISVDISKLKYWTENYRFPNQGSQSDMEEFLKKTGNFNKLQKSLADGILGHKHMVVKKDSGSDETYTVYDGNRRLAALRSNNYTGAIEVFEEKNGDNLQRILDIEHQAGFGAQLAWNPVQQARRNVSKKENLGLNEKSLLILEETLGATLDHKFPITTFARLINDDFMQFFSVTIDNPNTVKVKEKDAVKSIYEDIKEGRLTSRSSGANDKKREYIAKVKNKQDVNVFFQSGLSENKPTPPSKNENNGRLLSPKTLELIADHLSSVDKGSNHRYFIAEIRKAPLNKYPNLLALGLRCLLDSIWGQEKALDTNEVRKVLANNKKAIKFTEALVTSLHALAHNCAKPVTSSSLSKDQGIICTLIEEAIKQKKK